MKTIINIEDAIPMLEFITQLNLAISVMKSRNGFKPLYLKMNQKTYYHLLSMIDPKNILLKVDDCNAYMGASIRIHNELPTDMMIVDDIEDAPIYSQEKQDS